MNIFSCNILIISVHAIKISELRSAKILNGKMKGKIKVMFHEFQDSNVNTRGRIDFNSFALTTYIHMSQTRVALPNSYRCNYHISTFSPFFYSFYFWISIIFVFVFVYMYMYSFIGIKL